MLQIKRVYEPASRTDGYRVLVDRLWPRGVSKERAKLNLWLKEIAPSTELRQWFGHDPKKWPAFREKYRREVKANPTALTELKNAIKKNRTVTLLYAAKDEAHNEAAVLVEMMK
jgi:uncharacterized protein YeaO (DUF488 family)